MKVLGFAKAPPFGGSWQCWEALTERVLLYTKENFMKKFRDVCRRLLSIALNLFVL